MTELYGQMYVNEVMVKIYGSGHENAAVLLPGFAISW